MASNINPANWASWGLRAKDNQFDSKMQTLLYQLSQFATQAQQQLTTLFSASGLASILNGSGLIQGTALKYYTTDQGTVSSSPTINVAGYATVTTSLQISTAFAPTLTMNNLTVGVPVLVRFINSSGSTETFKMAATNPASTAYAINAFTSSGITNMVTGISVLTGTQFFFFGNSYGASPQLLGTGFVT